MMSDPEAGDSEGAENPDPEDEVHPSANTSNTATELNQSPHLCANFSSVESSNTVTTPAEAGASTSVDLQEDTNLYAQAVHNGENDGNGSDPSFDELAAEAEYQHEKPDWPAESDRSYSSTVNADVENSQSMADTEVFRNNETSTGASKMDGASIQEHISENERSARPDSTRSSIAESSDQEESPPEDELFNSGSSHVHVLQTETCTAVHETCSDDNMCQAVKEGDEAAPQNKSLDVESSTMDSHADTDFVTENAADLFSKHLSQPLCSPFVEGEVSEKDNDQVPECDREQSSGTSSLSDLNNSLVPSSAEIVKLDAQATDHSFNVLMTMSYPDGEHACLTDLSATAPCENVHNKLSCGSCGNTGDCDNVLPVQCNISQPASAERLEEHSVVRNSPLKTPLPVEDSGDEDLLTELDAELHLPCSSLQQQRDLYVGHMHLPLNGMKHIDLKNSELGRQFEDQLLELRETIQQQEGEISRLKDEKSRQREVSQQVMAERDKLRAELTAMKDQSPDDLYLPQIKELEFTLSRQQSEIRHLKEKLTSHDSSAKRAISTLQTEMKTRMDQITKLYEDCSREKDAMVIKFAEAETKNINAKCAIDKLEAKIRDLLKEKEFINNKMRAAMMEKQKAVAELQAKTTEAETQQKELAKVKEEMSSADYRLKWFQNKLKAELEAHKETKLHLEKTTVKLKEAKEETEMIRKDCQAIVKTYQESEEVRSNSLDKELRMKQTELMIKMKEKSETEEIHMRTKQELETLKVQHSDALVELKTLKDKIQCFEEERLKTEEIQNKYQTIIQNQKSDNASLSKQLTDFRTLQEDFNRAQDMIKSLDHEVNDLKLNNRDLQKDIESCQARESKMLTLQSELSRTNALLRSENTNLSNQVATLSGEVQKMKMDIQDLETKCRNLKDHLEEEQSKRQEETDTLSSQLAAKTKESEEFRQKWEDEIDASKTWKRKHSNNIKDLTRQLQHAKKRLESYENGSGDRDATSMGSRTNSNGSLNSVDNSNQHNSNHHGSTHPNHHPNHHPSGTIAHGISHEPEFPVITEQVEVDKQLLIERIVRLQRSLARKNEKLEFLEEHIQQLVAEIKRKNRIIQQYVMREEAGTMASDVMDANKLAVRQEAQALLAGKGGIMASVYSQHPMDGSMTLDLSLEINRKLQAVLEDTLLKNMTLKENLDTLGAEIARLSQENRRLQLHLQGLVVQ